METFIANDEQKRDIGCYAATLIAQYDTVNRAAKLEQILQTYPGTMWAENIYFSELLWYFFDKQNRGEALRILGMIDVLFPGSESSIAGHRLLDEVHPQGGVMNAPRQDAPRLPGEYALIGNYPNPFNPSTTIRYALPEESNVSIEIFDITGRLVRQYEITAQQAGWYEQIWDGRNLNGSQVTSGIYVYRFKAESTGSDTGRRAFVKSAKMMLVR